MGRFTTGFVALIAGLFLPSGKLRQAKRFLASVVAITCPINIASAFPTTTYTYDSLGRLVKTEHTEGPNDSVVVTQQYDPANNRTQQVVTGHPRGRVLMLPFGGLTLLPMND